MSNYIAAIGSKLNVEQGVVTHANQDFVLVEGIPVAVVGALGTTHPCAGGTMGGYGNSMPPGGGGTGYGGPGDTVGYPPEGDDTGGLPGVPTPCFHLEGYWSVSKGKSWVLVDGKPLATTGSATSCEHVVATGKSLVLVG